MGQVCESHGWRIHAWVLMGNHFHLLLETPEPNLVLGMKALLGPFSMAWNRQRLRRGHVFQGRYKSIPVSAATDSPYYFRIAADYIHLNPARAGLVGGSKGNLLKYKWSSLHDYKRGSGPDWLVRKRLLDAFELSRDGRGRNAYVAWMEQRAKDGGKGISDEAIKALKRGWYLGEPGFGDKLRGLLKPGGGDELARDPAYRQHDESEAERLLLEGKKVLDLPSEMDGLAKLRKGDERKVLIAGLIKARTSVGNTWVARRLSMGHPSSVSRLIKDLKVTKKGRGLLDKLKKKLGTIR